MISSVFLYNSEFLKSLRVNGKMSDQLGNNRLAMTIIVSTNKLQLTEISCLISIMASVLLTVSQRLYCMFEYLYFGSCIFTS